MIHALVRRWGLRGANGLINFFVIIKALVALVADVAGVLGRGTALHDHIHREALVRPSLSHSILLERLRDLLLLLSTSIKFLLQGSLDSSLANTANNSLSRHDLGLEASNPTISHDDSGIHHGTLFSLLALSPFVWRGDVIQIL